uniref:Uncharacterized protein n=1 Tax=Globodera pallida TaxID=36090 RepID=A0A183CCW0_GLOPA
MRMNEWGHGRTEREPLARPLQLRQSSVDPPFPFSGGDVMSLFNFAVISSHLPPENTKLDNDGKLNQLN